MKIMIEIEEDYYKIIQHDVEHGMDYKPCVLIANGTPLPKGHGRLIILSEDAVKREQIPFYTCQKWISEVALSNATVAIIEGSDS